MKEMFALGPYCSKISTGLNDEESKMSQKLLTSKMS